MTHRTWQFTLDGITHQVTLNYGLFKRCEIQLDGKIIYKHRSLLVTNLSQDVEIPGHNIELGILSGAISEEIYLRVDNEFVFAQEDKKQRIGKLSKRLFEDLETWKTLGKELGLDFYTCPDTIPPFRFRLVGYFSKSLVSITPAWRKNQSTILPGVLVMIKHAPVDEDKKKAIHQFKNMSEFLKITKIDKNDFSIATKATSLFILNRGKNSAQRNALIVKDFLHLVTQYLNPSLEECEGPECKSGVGEPLQTIFFNGIPIQMCSDCIDHIGEVFHKEKEKFDNQPANLGKGALSAVKTGTLGAIAGGFILIVLGKVGFEVLCTFYTLILFVFITNAVAKATTKMTLPGMVIALVTSELATCLGIFLGGWGLLVVDSGAMVPLMNVLDYLMSVIISSNLLRMNLGTVLCLLAPFMAISWFTNRRNLKTAFSPIIERLTDLRKY